MAAVILVVIGAAANLLGWDVSGWFGDLWDTITEISTAHLIAAVALITVQTTAAAFAWYSILRFAYPHGVRWREILACYAASVALNAIVPANLGTLAMLLMFTTIIAGATFAAILGAYAVEKIFWTAIGAFVYLYLFLTVGGSFDIKFSFVHEHPWSTAIVLVGGAWVVYLLARRLWLRVRVWWGEAKDGGAILARPRSYAARVFLPSLLSWLAYLGVIAIFLDAYGIPVSFETVLRIVGGNSIANVTSVTPGGAGVTQAFNVASLRGIANPQTVTAYSVAQQLVTTASSIVLALATLVVAFGWTGGRQLVEESYRDAKLKATGRQATGELTQAPSAEARPS